MYFRNAHNTDPKHHVSTFRVTSSTSSIRKHLYNEHIGEWVSSCDNLNISITAAGAKAAARRYHNLPEDDTPSDIERPQYSKEAFVDALVEFIIGDDQVCALSIKLNIISFILHLVN